ncbi:DUF3800 domain-containing protein [Streptomyces sp. NPDC048211]|uniref:DUF3800 domain-containing protein n=1 Tax=Streptomyces sp. NPDC048211 TaxID=3365516 RepID=UPI00371703CB
MTAQVHPGALPKLYVYVDETGDRGISDKASPFFAMTALMVPAEDDWTVRYAAAGLRSIIHTSQPDQMKPLHWVEHFKRKHVDRRFRAASALAGMPSSRVVHVVVPKAAARNAPGLRDTSRFYNYTTRLLLERVAYAASQWEGGGRFAIVRLGTVRGMDHLETARYLDRVRQKRDSQWQVPWHLIKWPPAWTGTDWDGIQLADLHAGLLNSALIGAPDDEACAANLLLCKHQLYRSPTGRLLGYGVKVLGTDTAIVTSRCWWEKWSVS